MSDLATLASAILTAIALVGSYLAWRTRQLRKDEVLDWGLQSIRVLQSTLILLQECRNAPQKIEADKFQKLKIDASVLCEQGRIFFKNERIDNHGLYKKAAYRGYRPEILDQLVLCFQICDHILKGHQQDIALLCQISEDSLKNFVTLLQKEVGRGRTASADTSLGGKGIHLDHMLAQARELTKSE